MLVSFKKPPINPGLLPHQACTGRRWTHLSTQR